MGNRLPMCNLRQLSIAGCRGIYDRDPSRHPRTFGISDLNTLYGDQLRIFHSRDEDQVVLSTASEGATTHEWKPLPRLPPTNPRVDPLAAIHGSERWTFIHLIFERRDLLVLSSDRSRVRAR